MTRNEIMIKAIEGRITWIQAASILGITDRQMRRLKKRYMEFGYEGLRDYRGGRPRMKRIAMKTIQQLCKLRREQYQDFSVKHFHEFATEKHGLEISYNWARIVLQEAGLAEKATGRGKYRRQRERRPMVGMMLHLDGSTHQWIEGLPARDLIIMLDDADGRILHGKFVREEGTMSTFEALAEVLKKRGRFGELYHDCGSHFGRTAKAGEGPADEQNGQVTRALKVLGIRQIFARSPQARGRSERCFETIQGRLPQELRLEGITDYDNANEYLQKIFIPSFNRRFTVKPVQSESAFVPLAGIDLMLVLSEHYERTVSNDNTIRYQGVTFQIPSDKYRLHYVRCKIMVHRFVDQTIGVSFQGRLLARYTQDGELITTQATSRRKAA